MQPTAEQLARLAETADRFTRLVDPSISAGFYGPWPHREPGEIFDAGEDADWPPRREAIIRAAIELDEAFPDPIDVTCPSGWTLTVAVAIGDVVHIARRIFAAWGLHNDSPRDAWKADRLTGVRLVAGFAESRAIGHAVETLTATIRERAGPAIIAEFGPVRIYAGKTVTVFGRAKKLTSGRYQIIKALVDAGPNGLAMTRMERIKPSFRKMLRDLAKEDPDWLAVIVKPGGVYQGNYRIDPTATNPAD